MTYAVRSPNGPRLLRFLLALLPPLLLLLTSVAEAHPMGFGTAEMSLSAGAFRVELVLDAPPQETEARSPAETQTYSEGLARQLREGFVITVDGKPAALAVKVLSVGTGPAAVDVARVSGRLPSGARQLVIRADSELGDIAIEIRGGPLTTELRGLLPKGNDSPPLDLTAAAHNSGWSAALAERTARSAPTAAASAGAPTSTPPAADGERRSRPPLEIGFELMFRLGIRHIVPDGLDHVLFVFGLLLLSSRLPGRASWLRTLALQLTLFTVSHSITLALGALGYVDTPASLIEPLIALSIVYVGVEPLLPQGDPEARPHRSVRARRIAVVFAFGLLHGLGFASALASRGSSGGLLVRSLFAFNVGVEVGQLLVAATLAALVFRFREHKLYFRYFVLPCGLGISGLGLTWFFQRLLG